MCDTISMKLWLAPAVLVLALSALALPAGKRALAQADAAPKGLSALELHEGLLARDAGKRDRAITELGLCTEQTALDLATELVRGGVRESEIVLRHVPRAASANACVVAVAALDSNQQAVRVAAMRALASSDIAHSGDAVKRQMTSRRTEVALETVQDSPFLKLECEALPTDSTGTITASVRNAMRLAILMDRVFGTRGTPLLLKRLAALMRGVAAEQGTPATVLEQAERVRRAAAVLLEALMVVSPASHFNYVPNAGFAERAAAAALVEAEADKLAKLELTIGTAESRQTVKGLRYGDYLVSLYRDSDISGHRAAAYLRMLWWRTEMGAGPEGETPAIIEGDGYADAVEKMNTMSRPDRTKLRRELETWWSNQRKTTEPAPK